MTSEARIYTKEEALALLETIRDGGVPCAPDCNGACVVAYSRALMRLRDAAPGLAASVAHHEARAERAEAQRDDARADYDSLAHDAARVILAVERDGLDERVRDAIDEMRDNGCGDDWWRSASKPAASPTEPPSIALRAERDAALAQAEELTRGLAVAQSARNELREKLRQAEALAQIHREERDACAAEALRLRAASDETLRRVRVVLDHFGVADCDDPLAALEEVPETADAVVDDEVAHANELTMRLDAMTRDRDALRAAVREYLAADDAIIESAVSRPGETYAAWRSRQREAPERYRAADAALRALAPEVPRG